MRKLVIIGLSLILAMTSCSKDENIKKVIKVKTIQIVPSSLSIVEEQTKELTVSILPKDATNQSIIWKSSDESIATISDKGILKAIKEGNATITASTSNDIKTTCQVAVSAKAIEVETIQLSFTEFGLYEGNTKAITAKILPENATDKTIKWTSSDPSIASIDDTGIITGISAGSVTIKATSGDGKAESICTGKILKTVDVTGINFIYPCTELYVGNKKYIVRDILPKEATNQDLKWSSSDDKLATVDYDGVVTAVAVGTVTITATAHNGINQSTDIEIKEVKTGSGFRISPTVTVCPLSSKYVHIYVSINHFIDSEKDMKVTWECSDPTKVKLEYNANPVFAKPYPYLTLTEQALNGDQVTVTATREDGLQSKCIVTVNRDEDYHRVSSVTGLPSMTMQVGDEDEFWCNVSPYSATNQALVYFNTDSTIASISKEGKVKALKAGECIITAWSVDCGRYVETIIKVSE